MPCIQRARSAAGRRGYLDVGMPDDLGHQEPGRDVEGAGLPEDQVAVDARAELLGERIEFEDE